MCNVRINHRIHSGGEERMALQEYKEPNVFKRYWKQIIVGILVVAVIVGGGFALWKYVTSQTTAVTVSEVVCLPENYNYRMNGFKLKIANDGKTIEKITVTEGFTEGMLEEVASEINMEENIPGVYNIYATQLISRMQDLVTGNESLSWFNSEITIDKEHYAVLTTYTFDLKNENFHSDNEKTQEFMKQFGMDVLFNEKTQKYEWSSEKQQEIQKEYNMICETK